MDLYERIKELAAQKHISIRQLEEKLGIANGTLRQWGRKNPGVNNVKLVADYFNVSVDYLLGREEKSTDELDEVMNSYGFSDSLKQSIKSTENYSGKPLTEENYKAMADLVNMYLQSVKAENQDK
ncbi:helix-turn-helix domain-containing protein [Lactococcus petauri]|uniref:Helix-turn-helix transcriptional regulator n=1 Tax=Lactococcus petauri TaxID=1940789 RepID=A0AAJ2IUK0_9LACT|nr:helix-turn-helix transcriptional regulator [Lactococcus petauri]MDT2526416.1 helix-turn-helix transcriptional regulator [Lactococcus petauri]MDT2540961.1 helix-turn-helix transcriptional regulator [Lactococcus petauri]MDT2557535.1 helix-turn-helix transcriptional regulator [Lactococcus petauri]MDT2559390.1 helix-turn-helix transcriptional regulator [Lactococcus petauri]MDT2567963.1 helix-turn-helix transcriptional regulator [Lactococcus petauri]